MERAYFGLFPQARLLLAPSLHEGRGSVRIDALQLTGNMETVAPCASERICAGAAAFGAERPRTWLDAGYFFGSEITHR